MATPPRRKNVLRRPALRLGTTAAIGLAALLTPHMAFGTPAHQDLRDAAATAAAGAAGNRAATAATAGAVRADGYLGVTFGFSDRTLEGRYENRTNPIYNLPMFENDGDEAHFWDVYVEQLEASGVDFVAPTIRGSIPGKPQYNKGGDTTKLADLVAAIKRRGAAIKISALDDSPASLTDKKNMNKHNKGGYVPKFDLADKTGEGEGGYQYMWDYNLRHFFRAVPADMRFTMDGRPVIYEWSISDTFFVNQGNGNSAAILRHVKEQAKAEFGVDPYFIVNDGWIKEDPAVADVADGVHRWFSMTRPYSLEPFKGRTYGVTVPAFHFSSETTNMNIDPDHGKTFKKNLDATVGAGADVTLVEGFSDWSENAATWRGRNDTYEKTRYDYPNQMINILRQYSRDPFPKGQRVEAEGADSFHDTTPGNINNIYRTGDIDIKAVPEGARYGYAVGSTAAGEWLQWKDIPLSGSTALKMRASTDSPGRRVRIDIDGKAGPVITLPDTGGFGSYRTVGAGTYQLADNSRHTVRITFLNGGVNLDNWSN